MRFNFSDAERDTVNPGASQMWASAEVEQRDAMKRFNKQNGGKGAKVIINGQALRMPVHGETGAGWQYPDASPSDDGSSMLNDGTPLFTPYLGVADVNLPSHKLQAEASKSKVDQGAL